MSDVQSHLSRHVPKASMTEAQVKAMGARAWVDHETLVVRLSQVTDPIIQGMIRAVADHLFERRAGG